MLRWRYDTHIVTCEEPKIAQGLNFCNFVKINPTIFYQSRFLCQNASFLLFLVGYYKKNIKQYHRGLVSFKIFNEK